MDFRTNLHLETSSMGDYGGASWLSYEVAHARALVDVENALKAIVVPVNRPSVEGELLALQSLVQAAIVKWIGSSDNVAVLREVRNIAAIAVRCLINRGTANSEERALNIRQYYEQ